MKQRIAEVLRRAANKLDPPPPPVIPSPIEIVMPVLSPEVAARIGKRMAEVMKTRPRLTVPILPPPPAPPAPRRLR